MTQLSPRQFALDTTRMLQQAGYQALWAGGCVRDELMGRSPTDYDVATSALPDQIRQLFGPRRTLPIGAAFGVITVIGPRSAGQIDVATFRSDGPYSDGRHPDQVTYSDARSDAQRRDFTINGLFFDPVAQQLIDYVGGREDLQRKLVRAIGDPYKRLEEDKLRMLRAVRFAAMFEFSLDGQTCQAVTENAPQITRVSAERIGGELTRMLCHPQRARAVGLLMETGLLAQILPPSRQLDEQSAARQRTIQILDAMQSSDLAPAIAALSLRIVSTGDEIKRICSNWRMPNEIGENAAWIYTVTPLLLAARQHPWPEVQRVLIDPRIESAMQLAAAIAQAEGRSDDSLQFCRSRLAWPAARLDPPPLIGGEDLREMGLPPGPIFARILRAVRDAQLLGQVHSRQSAIDLAREIATRAD